MSFGPSSSFATRLAPWFLAAAGLLIVLYLVRGVLPPVLTALALAYLLDPLVDRLEAKRVPRALGILVLLIVAFVVIGAGTLLLVPAVLADLAQLAHELPLALAGAMERLQPWLAEQGIVLPHSPQELVAAADANLRELAPSALGPLRNLAGTVAGGTASFVGSLAALLIVPVLAFYLLKDFDLMVAKVFELVPPRRRPQVGALASEVDQVVGEFVRGQLMVMVLLAILYAAGYALIGVPLAVPIGIVAGLLSFIPYVGSGVALVLGLLMVTLHFTAWSQLMLVVLVYGVVQMLEGFVITPRVVGDKLGIAPPWVLIALMVGAELYGLLGVMFALPFAAVLKVFLTHALDHYRNSHAFGGAPALAVVPDAPGLLRVRAARRRRKARGLPR
jgi:predicted PurR-regulated permease PerM